MVSRRAHPRPSGLMQSRLPLMEECESAQNQAGAFLRLRPHTPVRLGCCSLLVLSCSQYGRPPQDDECKAASRRLPLDPSAASPHSRLRVLSLEPNKHSLATRIFDRVTTVLQATG
jgi:hypothetical protein